MLVKRPTVNCTVWVQSVLKASSIQARKNLQCCSAMSSNQRPKSKRHFGMRETRRTDASPWRERACEDADKTEKARQSCPFRRWRGWWAYSLTARKRDQQTTIARFAAEQNLSAVAAAGLSQLPAAASRQSPLPSCGACRPDPRNSGTASAGLE
jgi:hypothetical protein